MKKILVIRYGGVGDIITILPVLKSLKKSGYSVVLGSNSRYKRFCEKYTDIDRFVSFDSTSLLPLFSGEKNTSISDFLNQFDIIISYTDYEEIFSRNVRQHFKGEIIFHSVKPENIREHIVKYILIPVYSIAESIYEIPAIPVKAEKQEFFVIHPGSGSVHKNWAKERFLEIYNKFSTKIKGIILLGYAEREQRDFWYKNIPSSYIKEPENIEDVVSYAEKSYFYLGNDSGISHLFSSTGIPSVVIFGPTSPHIWSPVGENVKILYKKAGCSPCSNEERRLCKVKTCLDLITVDDVLNAIDKLWKKI